MQIKGMQQEDALGTKNELNDLSFSGKQSPNKQVQMPMSENVDILIRNVNGCIKGETGVNGEQSPNNGTKSRTSPVDEEANMHDHSDVNALGFELGSDVGSSFPVNAYWGMLQTEEPNNFPNFQSFNSTSSMPSYGLNNNNSFPQAIPFGSIGQQNYLAANNQFSSPPGIPSMSMMGNVGPVGGFNYQASQGQNQRRAITAQHNYSSMGSKPLNPRFPWNNQPSSWANNGPQNISPWTMALQQTRALGRGNSINMGQPVKKSQQPMNINPNSTINTLLSQQQRLKRSPVSNQISGNPSKASAAGPIGSDRSLESSASYGNGPVDSMKMDGLHTQLLDIMRQSSSFDIEQQKDGPFQGDEGNPILDQTQMLPSMNGNFNYPFSYRPDRPERYSRKVFVGGLPPDIDEDEITASFSRFGPVVVDWPHKAESKSYFPPKGYCFLLFQEELSVQALIDSCLADDNKLYWCVTSPTMKDKPVQIRPWNLSDSDFVMDGSQPLDPRKTIFVGGVPRPLRAVELASIIDRLYGGVCYAGIDTDPELKYPKGAGRVAFSNQQSYIAAISARFVQLQHGDIDKRVEVKPYVLDDQFCDECQGARCNQKFAPFFCANITCLQYYCEQCWQTIHSRPGREYHKPLVKEGADRPRAVPFRWC